MTPAQLAELSYPTSTQWKSMFCGLADSTFPKHVCLHTHECQVQADVAYDIDSYLGFASSLAFAQQGIHYQPAPQIKQNMQSDIHIEMDILDNDPNHDDALGPRSVIKTQLCQVPHFMLGRVAGSEETSVFILFPNIVPEHREFYGLTHEQHRRWMDRIFMPSIMETYPAHYTQHLPSSYDQAFYSSYAAQTELRTAYTESYQAQQGLNYFLSPEHLAEVWNKIEQKIETESGCFMFSDAQIFFSAKGTKLRYKSKLTRPTLQNKLDDFITIFLQLFDLDFIYKNRLYIDIGKEICPQASAVQYQSQSTTEQPYVLLWKKCCLESYLKWLYDDSHPAAHSKGYRMYTVSMLSDAANLTSITPRKSTHREAGLIYSQFYGSVKESIDAAKTYPFQNEGLEEMALDPMIRKGAQASSKSRKRNISIIENGYLHSKKRLVAALRGSARKSFGLREEHRCTWALILAIRRVLTVRYASDQDTTNSMDLSGLTVIDPLYAWAIPTNVYMNFLYRNADKFATGFEIVRAGAEGSIVTWEQTKIMAMFLRCLRFSLAGHELRREKALWASKSIRDQPGEPITVRYGLGFSNTLERYGYSWIEPRINWTTLSFESNITDQILFGNAIMKEAYRRHGGRVRDFFDATRRIELVVGWLPQLIHAPAAQRQLIDYLIHTCLQQFRTDVVASIKNDFIDVPTFKAHKDGTEPFCYEYLASICKPDIINVMRQQRSKSPFELFDYLYSFSDDEERRHWGELPFRVIYSRCTHALDGLNDESRALYAFKRRFPRYLFRWHWLLPYPHKNGLTETNKKGKRQWYSISPVEGVSLEMDELRLKHWEMVSQTWLEGRPDPFPEWLTWERVEWETWFATYTPTTPVT